MNDIRDHVIIFDGYCNLCSRFVKVILLMDKKKKFRFANLQSHYAKGLFPEKQSADLGPESVIYVENGRLFYKSDAVLKISRELGGLMLLMYPFGLLPRKLRDRIYDHIASNRYRWFGKRAHCMVPDPELTGRFLP